MTNLSDLEKKLKSAKATAPRLPSDFSAKVMDQIHQQGLSPHSNTSRALLRRFAGVVSLMLALLVSNWLLYEVRMNGSSEMLHFGTRFLSEFISDMPYDLLGIVLLLGLLSGWLLNGVAGGRFLPALMNPTRNGFMRAAASWIVASYLISGLGGTALAFTGINEQMQGLAVRGELSLPWVGDFYRHRAMFRRHHPGLRLGQIKNLQNNRVILISPEGEEFEAMLPQGFKGGEGDHLRMAGVLSGRVFQAEEVQVCDQRRTGRYFRHMEGMGKMMERMREKGMGPMMRGMGGMGGMHGGPRGPMMPQN